jgi:probable HAF family extracellular repeat protein
MRCASRWVAVVCVAVLGAVAVPVEPAGAAPEGAAQRPRERPVRVTRLTTETGESLSPTYLELNERGQVAATLYRTDPLQSVVVLWDRGRVTQVSPDGVYAHPLDLSDRGHVTGEIYALDEASGWGWPIRPAFWSRGRWAQISSDSIAGRGGLDVNRRGQVVLPLAAPPYTAIWDGGELTLPPAGAGAQLVNDRGDVMGGVADESGPGEAATWRVGDDTVTRLGTLGGGESRGVAINERGDIAGNSLTAAGDEHAFLWRDGEMIDLGTLGGVRSFAADVNDRGDVVGSSITADGEVHAFLWRDGEMIDLGDLGTGPDVSPQSAAVAVNDHGQVVGFSAPPGASWRTFLWEDGRMTDIGVLAGEGPSRPVDINDRGEILGYATRETSGEPTTDTVLWTARPGRR